ncbi:probable G-protein coupled receptor Mth-like 3 isoform X2 [Pogonomyrmex barbatus]|uniref:Probable G-protein coupled receptor Mth-like 3 isoform X2 n=1 Tax=Pogonomyrmex barbatus TaxID=144034 RepID=A0A6I9W722_9HYME|nr:probable G-protein coupled receptor Mth-like 3 isoform X2 [Pogonomyrmex barbatus]
MLLLFGLVLSLRRVSSESHLAKCCPPGEVLARNSTVECVLVPSNATELYVYYLNITTIFQGIPQCDESQNLVITSLDNLTSNKFLEVPACFDILHEQTIGKSTVVVVHCRSIKDPQLKTSNASFPQLIYFRKCCPYDTIYDSRTKTCVSQLNASEDLTFLINEIDPVPIMITTKGPPTCKGPIVDYKIDKNDVILWDNTNMIIKVMVPALNNTIIKEKLLLTEDIACLEMMPYSISNRTLAVRVCRDLGFCDQNACIRKCCPENELLYDWKCNKTVISDEWIDFYQAFTNVVNQTKLSTFDTTKDYGVLIGNPCKNGKDIGSVFSVFSEEEWSLTSKGYTFLGNDVTGQNIYDQDNYCMDFHYNMTFDNFVVFTCYSSNYLIKSHYVSVTLQIIRYIFLLMTLLIYACLPSLKNLHGKTLICHISSLLLAFSCALIDNLSLNYMSIQSINLQIKIMLKVTGFTLLFASLSAFTWQNVMCFDIWWTFGALRGNTVAKAHERRKRFLLYCLYAWGVPLLLTILSIIADFTNILPYYLFPEIGIYSWFSLDKESLTGIIFYVIPVMILLISNVRFFILTSRYCNKVKAKIKKMTVDPADLRRFYSNKEKFLMNIKLFIVMGVCWNSEMVTFFLLKNLKKNTGSI